MTDIKIKNKIVAVVFLIFAFVFSLLAGRFVLAQEATETVQEPTIVSAPDPASAPTLEPTLSTTIEDGVGTPTSTSSSVVAEPAVNLEPTPTIEEPTPTSSEPTLISEPAQEQPTSGVEIQIEPMVSTLEESNTGIVFETSTSTAKSLPGYFDSRQILAEQKEENGKPVPAFWQVFYHAPDGTQTQITDNDYDNLQFQQQGTKAVWKAYNNPGHAEIFFYDAEIREKRQISINNSSNDDPVLTDDGWVVWRGWDTQLGTWNIYFYNGSETVKISNTTEGALWPSIAGDVIAWQEKSGGVWQIMAYNISTRRPWLITGDNNNNEHPQTDGRNIVWQKEVSQGLHDIFIYDLKTERLWNLSKKDFGDKVLPHIIENKKIAWFRKSFESDNPDFEEAEWDEKNIEELTAVKPKPVEETTAIVANNIIIENTAEETGENNTIPIPAVDTTEEEATASTTPQIMISSLATTTEEIVPEQSVIIDVAGAADELISPTTTVSLTEPAPEPVSEISLPQENPIPPEETSISIPITNE